MSTQYISSTKKHAGIYKNLQVYHEPDAAVREGQFVNEMTSLVNKHAKNTMETKKMLHELEDKM